MKNCKSTESFCLSILAIYTNDRSPFWHVNCCHDYFFCEIPKYVQTKNILANLYWHFIIEWTSMLATLAGYDEYRLAWFHPIRNVLANKIYHFQDYPIKQAAFLPGQPPPCNQLLIQPLLRVPKCYFAWNVEVRDLKF